MTASIFLCNPETVNPLFKLSVVPRLHFYFEALTKKMKIFLIFALFVAQTLTFTLEGKEFDIEPMELESKGFNEISNEAEAMAMEMEIPEMEIDGLDRKGRVSKRWRKMLAKCGLKLMGKGNYSPKMVKNYSKKVRECREKYGF